MGGVGNEGGFGITTDSEGNILVTGRFEGTVDFAPGPDINNISSAGSFDVFIVKLSSSGTVLWVRKAGGLGTDYGNAIAADSSNVYIIGNFTGAVDFDPGIDSVILSAIESDIYVWKLNSAGNLIWVKQMNGTLASYGSGISVKDGNVYYTGWFRGSVDFDPNIASTVLTSSSNNQDIVIARLNSSGHLMWVKQIGGTDSDEGHGIDVDISGNIYTIGYFSSTVDFNPGTGTINLIAEGGVDIFILKLDPGGNYTWAVRIGGSDTDVGNAISVTETGIHTTGGFDGSVDFDPGVGIFQLTSILDIFIHKLTHTTTGISIIDPDIASILLSPNLVSDVANLIVDSKKSKKLQWNLVDAHGRLVKSFTHQISNGRNTMRIYTGNLSKGEYFLVGFSEDGKTKSIPFVKYL